jgi:transposase-like protein
VVLRVPGDRPVRPDHRRLPLTTAGHRSGTLLFTQALNTTKVTPVEVITDKAAVYPRVLDELAPGAWHHTEQYAINRIEADHGQLKRRLRPMRGLKTELGATVVITGHAIVQNIRRGHYELGVEEATMLWVVAAFTELAVAI